MEPNQARNDQEEIVIPLETLRVLKSVERTAKLPAKIVRLEQLNNKACGESPKQSSEWTMSRLSWHTSGASIQIYATLKMELRGGLRLDVIHCIRRLPTYEVS